MQEKLTIKDVGFLYGDKTVLKDISFSVYDGEFLSILGPSGCGKTTLLRVLLGLERPTSGRVEKDGRDITHLPAAARGMGVVFQNYALFENMTVLGNVEYAVRTRRENRGRAERARIREEALALLQMMGLSEHKDKKPASLSGGQMQRTAIARTLLTRPDIILFDEPMSALDAATRLSLREELLSLKKRLGTTMIYVTHDQEEAFALSDRIMVMREAEVVQLDTPKNLLAAPADRYVRDFVLGNLLSRAKTLSALTGGEA